MRTASRPPMLKLPAALAVAAAAALAALGVALAAASPGHDHPAPAATPNAAAAGRAASLLPEHESLAHRFAELDRDRNGRLERSELPPPLQRFAEAGRGVTEAEFRARVAAAPVGALRGGVAAYLGVTALDLAGGPARRAAPAPDALEVPRPLPPQHHGVGRRLPDLALPTLNGPTLRLSTLLAEADGVVLAITDIHCPAAQRYAATWVRLAPSLKAMGYAVVLVNPSSATTPQEARAFIAEAGLAGVPYVLDPKAELARALAAATTTEAFLIDAARTLVYRGAVDDQYGVGVHRPAPRETLLLDAVAALGRGERPAVQATTAPGCPLDLEAGPVARAEATPTYHGTISRILQQNCVSCHRAGGLGPFPLDNHAIVNAMRAAIDNALSKGIMPPFYASSSKGHGPWSNDLTLAEDDKQTLLAYLRASERPEGDPADAPLPVRWAQDWRIGTPDLVVAMPKAVRVPASGQMPYVNIRMQTGLTEDKWVKALEIKAGARAVVHHILVFVVPPERASEPLADGAGVSEGLFAIYGPGTDMAVYPDGVARKLPKGSLLHFQVHYTPNGRAVEDLSRIALKFQDAPPEREARYAGSINFGIRIPAETRGHAETAVIRIEDDIEVRSLLPHAHYTGQAARYEILKPDGTRETWLDVAEYDFNWQTNYQFSEPRRLPAGSQMLTTIWYDNSSANPLAADPSKPIRWGEQSDEEMMIGYFEYLTPVRP